MPRRFQFSLRDLFWLTLVVASFLGGMALQWQRDKPLSRRYVPSLDTEWMNLQDGTNWIRYPDEKQ